MEVWELVPVTVEQGAKLVARSCCPGRRFSPGMITSFPLAPPGTNDQLSPIRSSRSSRCAVACHYLRACRTPQGPNQRATYGGWGIKWRRFAPS